MKGIEAYVKRTRCEFSCTEPRAVDQCQWSTFHSGRGLLRTVDSSCCLRDFRIYNTTLAAVPGVCRETLEVGYSQAAGLGAPFTFSFADILFCSMVVHNVALIRQLTKFSFCQCRPPGVQWVITVYTVEICICRNMYMYFFIHFLKLMCTVWQTWTVKFRYFHIQSKESTCSSYRYQWVRLHTVFNSDELLLLCPLLLDDLNLLHRTFTCDAPAVT